MVGLSQCPSVTDLIVVGPIACGGLVFGLCFCLCSSLCPFCIFLLVLCSEIHVSGIIL